MLVVRDNVQQWQDPWYNLGQILGRVGHKMYENHVRKQAAKESDNQKAEEMYDLQMQQNNALKGAYNAYDAAKNKLLDEWQQKSDAYNKDQSQANYDALVEYVKRVHPGANIDANAMTNARDYVISGQAAPLQAQRQAAQNAALAINPYADLTSNNWGTDTYQMGLNRANWSRDFKKMNEGKRIGGKGDKEYKDWYHHNAENPYMASQPGPLQDNTLQNGTPIQLTPQSQANNTMTLQQATPLKNNLFDYGALTQYVK